MRGRLASGAAPGDAAAARAASSASRWRTFSWYVRTYAACAPQRTLSGNPCNTVQGFGVCGLRRGAGGCGSRARSQLGLALAHLLLVRPHVRRLYSTAQS